MSKFFKFPLIFLVYLTGLLYFCLFSFSWLLLLIFVLSCGLAIWRGFWGMLPFLVLIAIFLCSVKFDRNQQAAAQPEQISQLRVISDSIEVNGNQLSFQGSSAGQKFQAYYTLKSQSEQAFFQNLTSNISVKFDGNLAIPESQRNFNGFDYRAYLATQNIFRVITITKIRQIQPEKGFDLHLLRRRALVYCRKHFPAPMSSYMTGLLFGYLGKDFEQMSDIYSSLGIIHLFALSGMQVNFFIELFRKILLRLGLRRDWLDLLQLPFSLLYAFLTGLAVSVLRALIQKNVRLTGLDNFALTFLILLLIRPQFLLTTGGALSMMYAFIISMIQGKFGNLAGVQRILLESSVISLGVLPLLVLDFHVFQPLSILLTFGFSVLFDSLLLPLLALIFILSNLTGISLDVNFIFIELENLVKLVNRIFHYPLVLGRPTLPILLALLLCCGLFFDFMQHKKWRPYLLVILALLFFLSKNPLNASITMVDIGQGDSFLLEDALNRHTVLIDTGGRVTFEQPEPWQSAASESNADKTLIPYLRSRGIAKLDTLILTHTDDDHVGDLLALADKVKIGQIWVTPGSLTNPSFVAKLKVAKTAIHVVKTGDSLPIFDSKLQVLSAGYTGQGDNNDSQVTYGKFYGKSFLFTGDLEQSGEQKLLKNYPDLQVDVLKAGHHGSKTSSNPAFIAAIKPQIALISAGLNNRYHHPNQETLDTFDSAHIKIYRTDQQGAVRFDAISGKWKISTVK